MRTLKDSIQLEADDIGCTGKVLIIIKETKLLRGYQGKP